MKSVLQVVTVDVSHAVDKSHAQSFAVHFRLHVHLNWVHGPSVCIVCPHHLVLIVTKGLQLMLLVRHGQRSVLGAGTRGASGTCTSDATCGGTAGTRALRLVSERFQTHPDLVHRLLVVE